MLALKCEACGANLKYEPGKKMCTCEYCGTTQMIPVEIPANNHSKLQRAYAYLMNKQWKKANDFTDMLLDEEPELYEAYLVKLLAEYKIDSEEELATLHKDISRSGNYQMIMRVGDEALKNRIHHYYILSAYDYFKTVVETSQKVEELEKVYNALSSETELDGVDELLEKCRQRLEVLRSVETKLQYIRNEVDRLNQQLLTAENPSMVYQVLSNIKQYYMNAFIDSEYKPILMELLTTKNLLAYASDSPFAVYSGTDKNIGVYKEKHQFFLFIAYKDSPLVKVCVHSSSDQNMKESPLDEKNVFIDFSKRSMPILRFKPITLNIKVTVDYI